MATDESLKTPPALTRLYVVWGGVAVMMATTWISVPALLLTLMTAPDASRVQGILTSVTALFGFLLTPIAGSCSDRFGRRAAILAWLGAYFLAAVCNVAAAVWHEVAPLVVGRIAALSIMGCVVHAAASDLSGPQRGLLVSQGRIVAAFSVGIMVGPAVAAGVKVWLGLTALFIVPTVVVPLLFAIATSLPTTMTTTETDVVAPSDLTQVRPFVIAYALVKAANVAAIQLYVIYLHARLGWGPQECGIAMSVTAFCGAIVQTVGVPLLLPVLSAHPYACLHVLLGMHVATQLGLAAATTSFAMWCVLLASSCNTLVHTLFVTILSQRGVGSVGLVLGATNSVQNAMEVGFAIAAGYLLAHAMDNYGPHEMGLGLPFVAISVLYVVAGVFVARATP